METPEYALIFTALTVYLIMTYTVVNTLVKPTLDPTTFLRAIALVAFRPSSSVQVNVVLPRGIWLIVQNDTVSFLGYNASVPIPLSLRYLGLIKDRGIGWIALNGLQFRREIVLPGGYIYTLKVVCSAPSVLDVEVVEQRVI